MINYRDITTGELIECQEDEQGYHDTQGRKLILQEDMLTGSLSGIRADKADEVRQDFIGKIKNYLKNKKSVDKIADDLYDFFSRKDEPWLSLPSDTRPPRNRASLADHSLLTSGIAVAMVKEFLARGNSHKDFTNLIFSESELVALVRIASFCHDLGKHPPANHGQRGMASVRELLMELLSSQEVDVIAGVAERHHFGRYYQEHQKEPLSRIEQIVALADTASCADRVVELEADDQNKDFKDIEGLEKGGYKKYLTTKKDLERITSSTRDMERDFFGQEPPLALILADVDRVKDYTYGSAKLPEVRGASLILNKLNRKGIKKLLFDRFGLPPECLIYAAGGGALIIVPASLAEEIKEQIRQIYLKKTKVATISVVSKPVSLTELQYGLNSPQYWFDDFYQDYEKDREVSKRLMEDYLRLREDKDDKVKIYNSFLRRKRFGELTAHLGYKLRGEKDSKETAPIFEVAPYLRRCDSCEIRPASKAITEFRKKFFFCQVCLTKRDEGREGKARLLKEFKKFIEQEQGNYLAASGNLEGLKSIEVAPSLVSIGKAAPNPAVQNYVGVISMDGNDVGSKLEELTTPAEYRNFARKLYDVTKKSVFSALTTHLRPKEVKNEKGNKEKIHPFEIVIIGGDDLFLFVPADAALEIAASIARNFEEGFKDDHEIPKLTISGGVLISHAHHPVYFMQKVADGLLKKAKSESRKEQSTRSMIDFMVISSDPEIGDDLEEYMKKVYQGNDLLGKFEILTERPYDLDRLDKLMKVARKIKEKGFPKGQLYKLRESLKKEGMLRSRNYFRYQLDRHKEKLEQLRDLLDGDIQDDPWRIKKMGYVTTPIVDLVEIYDFVGEEVS